MKTLKLILCMALLSGTTLLYAESDGRQESQTAAVVMEQGGNDKYVNIESDTEVTRIIIRSLSGEIMYEKGSGSVETMISIQGWEKGRYIVTIYHGARYEVKSFSIL